MANGAKKYTLMWIPRSGLFWDGGNFLDGKQERINWDRTIRIYASHARAETAKSRIMLRYPEAYGELVILPIEIQEIPDEENAIDPTDS